MKEIKYIIKKTSSLMIGTTIMTLLIGVFDELFIKNRGWSGVLIRSRDNILVLLAGFMLMITIIFIITKISNRRKAN